MLVEATTSNMQHPSAQFSATTIMSSFSINGEFISGNPPFIKQCGLSVTHLQEFVCCPDTLHDLYLSLNQGQRYEEDVLMGHLQGEAWYHLVADNSQYVKDNPTILPHHYDIHERKTTEQTLRQQAWRDPLTG